MKCEILRNPGLDLIHNLAAKGIEGPVEVPKDLVEGETRDLPDDVAEALIACGVARAADKSEKPRGGKHESPPAAKQPAAK